MEPQIAYQPLGTGGGSGWARSWYWGAVAAVWPRMRGLIIAYALLIAFTRLVLLAHHPSDVVAGAAIGLIGAMCVRYWLAVRGLGFAVGDGGVISPAVQGLPKGVAAEAPAP